LTGRSSNAEQLAPRQCTRRHDQTTIAKTREGGNSTLHLARVAHIDGAYLHSKRRRGRLDGAEHANPCGDSGIAKHARPRHTRCDLFEQFQPFRAQTVFEHHKASGVAAGLSQAFYKTRADRIGHDHKYGRHGSGCL